MCLHASMHVHVQNICMCIHIFLYMCVYGYLTVAQCLDCVSCSINLVHFVFFESLMRMVDLITYSYHIFWFTVKSFPHKYLAK